MNRLQRVVAFIIYVLLPLGFLAYKAGEMLAALTVWVSK